MIDLINRNNDTINSADVKSLMRRKFVRIILGKREYCFRISQVLAVLDDEKIMIELNGKFDEDDHVFGTMKYKDGTIPVVDLANNYYPIERNKRGKCTVVICDVISDGLLMPLGIMVSCLEEIIEAGMTEIGEEMLIHNNKKKRLHEPRNNRLYQADQ